MKWDIENMTIKKRQKKRNRDTTERDKQQDGRVKTTPIKCEWANHHN